MPSQFTQKRSQPKSSLKKTPTSSPAVNSKPNLAALKKLNPKKKNNSQSSDSTLKSSSSLAPNTLISALKSCDSPRFYFPANSVPSLHVLMNNIESLKKCDLRQPKSELSAAILAARLSTAKRFLSTATKTRISRLPNEFFLMQRQLVNASVEAFTPPHPPLRMKNHTVPLIP